MIDSAQTAPVPAAQPVQGEADPWKPSGADYDRSIHSNPDAKAWADFFVATFPGQAAQHGLMLGWFANAMMAMHDHIRRTEPTPAVQIAAPGDVEQRSVDTLEQFIIDNIDAQRLFWMLRDNVKGSDFRVALEGMLSAYAALRSQGQANAVYVLAGAVIYAHGEFEDKEHVARVRGDTSLADYYGKCKDKMAAALAQQANKETT